MISRATSANIQGRLHVYEHVSGEAIGMLRAAVAPGVDDSARLERLFEIHQPRLYRLARRMSSSADEAADLVQETFLRVARRPGSLPPDSQSEEAWLVRVLVNLCRDEWRKRDVRRRYDQHEGHVSPPRPSLETQLVAHATVWGALRELAPRRRAAIVMYELEGASIPRIAACLGIAAVTVRWHLSRGRKELAAIIGGSDKS